MIQYEKVYSPVAGWSSIRIPLILVALEGWKTTQLDYAQAFPQAPIGKELYLKVTSGFQVEYGYNDEYAFKLHRRIYDQKQAGRVWNNSLTKNLIKELGFTNSGIDECVFYMRSVMYILYTYDPIISVPNKE